MAVGPRGWWQVVFGAAIAALVGAWFRHRDPEILDEPAPGTAQWPPLLPLPGDITDIAPPGPGWVAPDDDGTCPVSHPIKAKDASRIHHAPGGFSYERTHADRCYAIADDAEADGYRAAKR